jgi:hypothetical protein
MAPATSLFLIPVILPDDSKTIVVTIVDRCVGCAKEEYVLS